MLMIPTLNQAFSFYSLLRHFHVTMDEIVAFQNRQLRRLINNAYHNVPYYRRLFDDHRIKPQDIRSVSDLPSIPITSRIDLQKLPLQDRLASGVDERKLIVRTTSGSTGEPLVLLRTRFEERLLMFFRQRSYRYSGLRMRDRMAKVSLCPQRQKQCYELLSRVIQALGLYRHLMVSCLQKQDFILNQLKEFHPDVIQGYPGILSRIAVMISRENRRVLQPRFIYQLIQEKIERIILRIVVFENATPHELTRLRGVVESVIGPGVGLWIEQVQEIQLEPGGKFRPCRSLVRSEYDGIRWDGLGTA